MPPNVLEQERRSPGLDRPLIPLGDFQILIYRNPNPPQKPPLLEQFEEMGKIPEGHGAKCTRAQDVRKVAPSPRFLLSTPLQRYDSGVARGTGRHSNVPTAPLPLKLPPEQAEPRLVQRAREIQSPETWIHLNGIFTEATASFSRRGLAAVSIPHRGVPVSFYFLRPSAAASEGPSLDSLQGFKVISPSLADYRVFTEIRSNQGTLSSTKLVDGWGVWTFGLSDSGVRERLLDKLNDKTLREWIQDAYIRHRYYSLAPTPEQRLAFEKSLYARGLLLHYNILLKPARATETTRRHAVQEP